MVYLLREWKTRLRIFEYEKNSSESMLSKIIEDLKSIIPAFLISVMLAVVPLYITKTIIIKFWGVEKLGHVFIKDQFTAKYSCKYSYKGPKDINAKYGNTIIEWETPSDDGDCAIYIDKIGNAKLKNCCTWHLESWDECVTTSGRQIWIYLLDDKLTE